MLKPRILGRFLKCTENEGFWNIGTHALARCRSSICELLLLWNSRKSHHDSMQIHSEFIGVCSNRAIGK
jgi:hypothetical protein